MKFELYTCIQIGKKLGKHYFKGSIDEFKKYI